MRRRGRDEEFKAKVSVPLPPGGILLGQEPVKQHTITVKTLLDTELGMTVLANEDHVITGYRLSLFDNSEHTGYEFVFQDEIMDILRRFADVPRVGTSLAEDVVVEEPQMSMNGEVGFGDN